MRDVSHNLGSSAEACSSLLVTVDTLPDERNFGRHVPANGSVNINMFSKKK